MKKNFRKKRFSMTLLEVMIVMFVIGIIGSVVGYNMRGSLDHSRAFKTKEGIKKLYEILQLEGIDELAQASPDLTNDITTLLKRSGFVKKPKELLKDGWGRPLHFTFQEGQLQFESDRYNSYCEKKGVEPEYPWDHEELDTPSH